MAKTKERKKKSTGDKLAKEAREVIADNLRNIEAEERGEPVTQDAPADPSEYLPVETKPKRGTKKPKADKPPKAPKVAKERIKPTRPLSLLGAAIQCLQEEPTQAWNTARLVELVAQRGLWHSPAGRTPDRTLYAAFLSELKKDEPRVVRVGPGLFKAA